MRKLTDLVNTIIEDIDEDKNDSQLVSIFKKYVNRAYKALSKHDKLETSVTVTSTDYKFAKPSDFFKGSKLVYQGKKIEFYEEGSNIVSEYSGEMTFYYYKVPANLGDDDTPETNAMNDEYIFAYAKYLYYNLEDDDRAEIYKRDYETFNIIKPKKKLRFTVVR